MEREGAVAKDRGIMETVAVVKLVAMAAAAARVAVAVAMAPVAMAARAAD